MPRPVGGPPLANHAGDYRRAHNTADYGGSYRNAIVSWAWCVSVRSLQFPVVNTTPGLHLVAHREDHDGHWMDHVEQWTIDHCGDTLQLASRGRDRNGREGIFLVLHPAADELQILDGGEGRVIFTATTASVGPGYHAYLCRSIKQLAADMQWTWRPGPQEMRDSTGYFLHGDERQLREAMLLWLQAVARYMLEGASAGGRDFALSLPADVRFRHEGLVATPLGPRSAQWVQQVAEEPELGQDVFPWWSVDQDARYWLNRALCLMWSEVRWRPPLDEEEHNTLRDVSVMLAQARELDESLEYPWTEWDEIHRLLGSDGPETWLIRSLAEQRGKSSSLVGYRRSPVFYQPFDGWVLEIPGSMSIHSEQEGQVRVMYDIGRTVRLSAIRGTLANGGPAPAPALLQRFIKEQGEQRLSWQDDDRLAQGAIVPAEGGWTLHAVTAMLGHAALLTVSWTTESDRAWALDLWRSLGRPG